MQPPTADYLLAATTAEVERLQIQARAWEPEVETMLNEMGVGRGWRCIDIGCGPMGIIGPLARRKEPGGTVVALDKDALQLRAARQYAESEALRNVEFVEGDLFTVDLPAGAFDLVHARFVLAPWDAIRKCWIDDVCGWSIPVPFVATKTVRLRLMIRRCFRLSTSVHDNSQGAERHYARVP